MALTERKLIILQAIIDDYITTGIPVGSRTLSKHKDLNYSSATIRNDMADLEEEGYLEQPHASAGRMPSDKAYRLYVDTLMRVSVLDSREIEYIEKYFTSRIDELEQIIDNAAKVLSDITNLTSVVLAPKYTNVEINRIQIVKLAGEKALLLIVFDTGLVKDVLIDVPHNMDASYFDMISNLITDKVRNLTLAEVAAEVMQIMQGEVAVHRDFVSSLFTTVIRNANANTSSQVILGGAQNMFNYPEYRDAQKAKNFLQLLESREPLYEMLSRATDMEFTVHIGRENDIDELKDMSVVTATYKIGKRNTGSFGVIGPTRMDYGRVISVLGHVGASMNEIFSGFLPNDEKE